MTGMMDAGEQRPLLADYKVERWLMTGSEPAMQLAAADPSWKQLTQYAAYHAINAWYTMLPTRRSYAALCAAFDGKWTNKTRKFDSTQHYNEVREIVLHHLYSLLSAEGEGCSWPHMVFESSSVFVPQLDVRLSMIIHLLAPAERTFALHKYVMEERADVMELFTHMSIVFSHAAFGVLPEHIRIINIMTGTRHVLEPQMCDVEASMDYLRLIKGVYSDCGCSLPTVGWRQSICQ